MHLNKISLWDFFCINSKNFYLIHWLVSTTNRCRLAYKRPEIKQNFPLCKSLDFQMQRKEEITPRIRNNIVIHLLNTVVYIRWEWLGLWKLWMGFSVKQNPRHKTTKQLSRQTEFPVRIKLRCWNLGMDLTKKPIPEN